MKALPDHFWGETEVAPGARASTSLLVSSSYFGADIRVPLVVWRGKAPGPTVAIIAAVHGDEINGTGIVRHIITEQPFELRKGTVVLAPVVNVLGFERLSRYLPDRRDLNRSFPGAKGGSLASRMARSFFDHVIRRCDACIDLHTAAIRRTNFPNVRADMTSPEVAELARAFGAELIVNGKGPQGSLRRSACAIGCRTIILEAGEAWKVEPAVVEYATRGISNTLAHLGMIKAKPIEPHYRIEASSTKWVRAKLGGFLQFHIAPGDFVAKGDPIATNTSIFGDNQNTLDAPRDGVVLGMTTMPAVAPGDPICHLAFPTEAEAHALLGARARLPESSLHERVRGDLARNIHVTEPAEEAPG
ncbi:MAG: succinylglutamate desuccinylase/aspartoacylase family protein [Phycisphaerales bacterium]|nr:succinylglutamate desuccinylase/aspartoacylase family protein [Phycisphaerales bacterium]